MNGAFGAHSGSTLIIEPAMTRDTGDEKMQNAEMAGASNVRGTTQRVNGKARLSPELQELVHMLSSLEHQFTREDGEE
jgi:hypothetical protein